jgi:hypothetical protein
MTILLLTHIVLAVSTLVIAAIATVNVKAKKATSRTTKAMWYSFGGIVLTGFGLFIANPNSLGHLCALTAVYAALLSSVQVYSKKMAVLASSDISS